MNIIKLKEVGIDYDTGLKRFAGKPAMYERFLIQFFEDQSYAALQRDLAKKDYENAFKDAHTLKGILGNLSMDSAYDVMCEIVEALRSQQIDSLDELITRFMVIYQEVKAAVLSMD